MELLNMDNWKNGKYNNSANVAKNSKISIITRNMHVISDTENYSENFNSQSKMSPDEFETFMRSCNKYVEKQEYKLQEMNSHITEKVDSYISIDNSPDIPCIPDFDFDSMNGSEFEIFCSDLLKKNGFYNVKITPKSVDHGIDILAEKYEITYAIQCKCYSDNIGNSAIQQAHTGKTLYHRDIAVVMTNRYFSSQAREEATTLGVKLWDRDKLNEMIEKVIA